MLWKSILQVFRNFHYAGYLIRSFQVSAICLQEYPLHGIRRPRFAIFEIPEVMGEMIAGFALQ
jgi:hypothetical protein